MTVEDHLRDKTPHAVELFRAFGAALRECGPVRAHPMETRINAAAPGSLQATR